MRGARAEEIALAYLLGRGLSLLGRNVRVGRLELDLVLREGDVVVVVEVRLRGPGALQRALDSVDARKRARVRAAGARLWRERFAKDATLARMRFDVAAVELDDREGGRVEHVKAAI